MTYPLYWQYVDRVEGEGFAAAVVARGRCLMRFEDDEWWITAVEPGGFAGHGAVAQLAMKDFQITWTQILEDCAFEKKSFSAFEAEVRALFASSQISQPDDADWKAARQKIRVGKPVADGIDQLNSISEDLQATIQVVTLDRISEIVLSPLAKDDGMAPLALAKVA